MALANVLVTTDWLEGRLGDASLRIYDCTTHLIPDLVTTFRAETARADWEPGRIHDGSLTEWCADPALPVERG